MSNERRVTSNEERKKRLQRRGYKALRHAEFSSASHREPLLTPLLGEILKQVQDDVIVSDEH